MYKPKLEEILNDIIVITEVAELAAEADNLEDDENSSVNKSQIVDANLKKRGALTQVRWSSVRFKKKSTRSSMDSEDEDASLNGSITREDSEEKRQQSVPSDKIPYEKRRNPTNSREISRAASSGRLRIKNLLDRWDEPVNKLDKVRILVFIATRLKIRRSAHNRHLTVQRPDDRYYSKRYPKVSKSPHVYGFGASFLSGVWTSFEQR
jgi:hypothetical protein